MTTEHAIHWSIWFFSLMIILILLALIGQFENMDKRLDSIDKKLYDIEQSLGIVEIE